MKRSMHAHCADGHADKFSLNKTVVASRLLAIQDTESLPLTAETVRKMVGAEKLGGVRDMRVAPKNATIRGQMVGFMLYTFHFS